MDGSLLGFLGIPTNYFYYISKHDQQITEHTLIIGYVLFMYRWETEGQNLIKWDFHGQICNSFGVLNVKKFENHWIKLPAAVKLVLISSNVTSCNITCCLYECINNNIPIFKYFRGFTLHNKCILLYYTENNVFLFKCMNRPTFILQQATIG